MSYQVAEVKDIQTFDRVFRAVWKASHHPYSPTFNAYNPVFGPLPSDTENAIQAAIQRRWKRHENESCSHWVYVFDQQDADKKVAGACHWRFYPENPYHDESALPYDPQAWPEGSTGREFVTVMQRKHFGHRMRWLRRKHAILQDMAVLPEYRKKGIASLLMTWGMDEAEKQGLEVFFHASDMGRRLYERYGMRVIARFDIDMQRDDASDEWERLRHQCGPLRFSVMWKPAGGVYEAGRTQLPWEISS